VAVITELVSDDGVPLHGDQIPAFAATHRLPYLRIGTWSSCAGATTR
jgi:hypothetical protein